MRMKSLLNGNVWLWDRGKFMNRRFLMQVITDSEQSLSPNLFIYQIFIELSALTKSRVLNCPW